MIYANLDRGEQIQVGELIITYLRSGLIGLTYEDGAHVSYHRIKRSRLTDQATERLIREADLTNGGDAD